MIYNNNMESDQLEEYRKRMQARHTQKHHGSSDEQIAKRLQEEEERKLLQEEQAKHNQSDMRYQQPINQQSAYQQPPVYQQPMYQQPYPQPYQQAFYQQPVRQQSGYVPANRPANPSQPLLQSQRGDCLPRVDDKCCGINTQTVVLISAGLMTVGVVVLVVLLATL